MVGSGRGIVDPNLIQVNLVELKYQGCVDVGGSITLPIMGDSPLTLT